MGSLLRTQYSCKSETPPRLSVTPRAQHSLGTEVSWRGSVVIVLRRPAGQRHFDTSKEPVVGSWGGHDDLIHLGETGRSLTSSQRPLPSNAEPPAPPQLLRFWVACCPLPLSPASVPFFLLAPSSSSSFFIPPSSLISLYFLGSCFLSSSGMS